MSRLDPRASLGNSKMGEPAMDAQQRPHMVSTIEALSRKLGAKTGLAAQIANTLRNLILAGELRPGDRIRRIADGAPAWRRTAHGTRGVGGARTSGTGVAQNQHGCIVTTFTRE